MSGMQSTFCWPRARAVLSEKFRFTKYKPWMRTVLVLWWFVLLLGLATYARWYDPHLFRIRGLREGFFGSCGWRHQMIKLESVHIEEVRGIKKLDLVFGKGNFPVNCLFSENTKGAQIVRNPLQLWGSSKHSQPRTWKFPEFFPVNC